jgi:hypothetical protein
MDCYDCLDEARAAVAVCRLCGRGTCREHCVRLERCVYEHVASGMAAQLRPTGERIAMMVCGECAAALGQSELEEKVIVRPACCPPRPDRR